MDYKYNPYGTHFPLLKYVTEHTTGDIVECGVGTYSTNFLHNHCVNFKRLLLSLDNDDNWLNQYKHLYHTYHKLLFTSDWQENSLLNNHWSIAFIDQNPALQRKETIKQLINNVDYFIVHDIENEEGYKWSEILGLFKYKFLYNKLSPNTILLSNKDILDITEEKLEY
jgi:hypothetical protein